MTPKFQAVSNYRKHAKVNFHECIKNSNRFLFMPLTSLGPSSCCSRPPKGPESQPSDIFMDRLATICRIAFVAVTYHVRPQVVKTAAFLGLAVGLIHGAELINSKKGVGKPVNALTTCATSIFEMSSGLRATPAVALIASTILYIEHALHNPSFYGRVFGLLVGYQIGRFHLAPAFASGDPL